jgi:hypothetical protein
MTLWKEILHVWWKNWVNSFPIYALVKSESGSVSRVENATRVASDRSLEWHQTFCLFRLWSTRTIAASNWSRYFFAIGGWLIGLSIDSFRYFGGQRKNQNWCRRHCRTSTYATTSRCLWRCIFALMWPVAYLWCHKILFWVWASMVAICFAGIFSSR